MNEIKGIASRAVATASVILSPIVLSACFYVQTGNRFDMADVRAMRPGVTTEAQAVAKLGKPASFTDMGNGTHLDQWMYVYGSVIGGGGAHAGLIFGDDGKLVRIAVMSEQ